MNKKLNFHYYEALKKVIHPSIAYLRPVIVAQALFKPAAWFKGVLLPVLLDGCTLREAVIFGSVLSKVSQSTRFTLI